MFFRPRAMSLVTTLLVFLLATATASAAPIVLPSTHVLALLTAQALGTSSPPLMPANVSPHDFNLKPSHIRRLHNAQLVVWLGPELEPYLAKIMQQIPEKNQLIISNGSSGRGYGQHPWTSPAYLLQGINQLSQRLGTKWDDTLWLEKTEQFQAQLLLHSQRLSQNGQGYLVYHDGLDGFEAFYGLSHLESFTGADDQAPGAKRLATIVQLAEDGKVACILVDHEVKHRLVDAVLGPEVKRITIDILAANSNDLADYIRTLQKAVLGCHLKA
jgi:zinc transport system substrate-binding protein